MGARGFGRLVLAGTAAGALALSWAWPALASTPGAAPPPPHAAVPPPGTGELTGMRTELGSSDSGMPPGIVNGPCTPTPAHPYPVVLVHGTLANENFSWQTLAPMLSDAGYCVFGLNYGATAWTTDSGDKMYGLAPVEDSARQLESFIRQEVLPDTYEPAGNAAHYPTGAHPEQVDLVGHSQGGMMPRYLIDTTGNRTYPGLGDAAQVHTLVGLAPSNDGTTLDGVVTLARLMSDLGGQPQAPYQEADFSGDCGACGEQEAGSPFLQALNVRPDATGVDYYVIESERDEVVTPYTNAFLPTSENVQDVTLQNQCPTDETEHLGIIYDPVALQDVMAALADNTGRAEPLPQPRCPAAVPPLLSG